MTRAATAQNLDVVNSHHRRPEIGGVAGLANIRRLNVRRTFASGLCTVMTACTIVGDVYVVEVRRQPRDRAVAVITGTAADNVGRVLAGRGDAVMTGTAGTKNLCMIDGQHRCPKNRGMAVLAYVGGLNVGRTFAGGIRAVVAVCAITVDVCVVKIGGQPGNRGVAVVAVITADHMSRMLARRRDTVMTRAAVAYNLGVIDGYHRAPYVRRVAILANAG